MRKNVPTCTYKMKTSELSISIQESDFSILVDGVVKILAQFSALS